jgi:protein-disulfide isomerase
VAKSHPRDTRLNPTSTGPARGLNRAARRRGERSRPWWSHPAVIFGSLAVLGGIGFFIQSQRADRLTGMVQRPAHALGPGGSEAIGPESAPVLVEEYGDFECERCAEFQKTLEPQIRKLVDQGKVRLAYYPVLTQPGSLAAANASVCAGDHGAFWPYHDYLFARKAAGNSGALTSEQLTQFGRQVGINSPDFAACVGNGTYNGWVNQITAQGAARGVRIMPTIFVNGRVLPDPFAAPAAIQEALKIPD